MNKEEKFKILQQLLSEGYEGSVGDLFKQKEQEEAQVQQQQQQQQTPSAGAPTPALGGKVNLQPQQTSTERNIIRPGQYKKGGIKINNRMDHGGPHDKKSYTHIPQDSLINRQQFNESRFKSDAVSEDGATSIAQIMPDTFADGLAKGYVPKGTSYEDLAADDKLATQFQEAYMKDLGSRDWNKGTSKVKRAKSLAAYNMGPTGLVNHLNAEKKRGVDIYNSLEWVDGLSKESREYVYNIMLGGDKKYEEEYNREHKKKFKGGGFVKKGSPKKTGGYYSKYSEGGPTLNDVEEFSFNPELFNYDNEAVSETTSVSPFPNPISYQESQKLGENKNKTKTVEEPEEVDNVIDPIGTEMIPFFDPEMIALYTDNVILGDNTLIVPQGLPYLTEEDAERAGEIAMENETIVDANEKATNIDISTRRNKNKDLKTKLKIEEEAAKTLDAFYNQYNNIDYDDVSADQVKAMQQTLYDADYNLGNFGPNKDGIDGKFGNKTRLAYLDYMKKKINKGNRSNNINFSPSGREEQCDETGCAEYVTSEFMNEGYNVDKMQIGGDAWTMHDQMVTRGNATSIYNIYNGDEFKNVTSASDSKKKSIKAYRNADVDAGMFQEGDVIGLVYDNSSNWDNAYRDVKEDGTHFYGDNIKNKTYNSHVGFVSGFNGDGDPIISHNVNGKVYNDVYTNIHGGGVAWITRPTQEGATGDRRYDYTENTTEHDNSEHLTWLGEKNERTYSPEVQEIQNNSINFIKNNVPIILDELAIPINGDDGELWLQEAVIGIGMKESGLGSNLPDLEEATQKRQLKQAVDVGAKTLTQSVAKNVWDLYNGEDFTDVTTNPNNISLGITKVKLDKYGSGSKSYYNIGTNNIEKDHNATLALSIDNLARNYQMLTDYAALNPQLKLTEDDIRNMTILSHNRGLLTKNDAGGGTGTNFGQRNDMTIDEQVESLRSLYEGNMKDISSTNYRFLPEFIGDPLYENEFGEDGSETYISSVNRYINRQIKTHKELAIEDKENKKTITMNINHRKIEPNTAQKGGYRSKYGF